MMLSHDDLSIIESGSNVTPRKINWFLKLLITLGQFFLPFIPSDRGNNSQYDIFCEDDLVLLQDKYLPDILDDQFDKACILNNMNNYSQEAGLECDWEKSEDFQEKFEKHCKDEYFHIIVANIVIFPGDVDLYISSTTEDSSRLNFIEEHNLPIYIPKTCSFDEAMEILDKTKDFCENENGYQRVTYSLVKFGDPTKENTSSSSRGGLPWWALLPIALGSNFILCWN